MKIYCTAYPRSGITWLVRLLSDLLNSPQDGLEIDKPIWWGSQGGDHTIVKTHWRSDEYLKDDHKYSKGDHKIIVSQRDPRDVAVSAMYYSSLKPTDKNLMNTLETMVDRKGVVPIVGYHVRGWYQRWLQDWFDSNKYDVLTKYEFLSDFNELRRIVYELTGKILPESRIKQSMERQSFENLSLKYPHSIRKGIVGDWRNHFKKSHGEYITKYLGGLMIEQGYIEDLEWWREL